jgi:hypothetical protein
MNYVASYCISIFWLCHLTRILLILYEVTKCILTVVCFMYICI